METNRLRQFCLIYETGSLSRTSELLHVTHSSLSKSMKVLQDEVGIALLQPSGRGIAVTEDGKKFYLGAKQLLEAEKKLIEKDSLGEESPLRIGSVEIFLYGLSRSVKATSFAEKNFTLLDLEPGTLEKMIAEDQLDYGITYAPYPNPSVEVAELGRFELGCFHLEGSFKRATFGDLPFVLPERGLSQNPFGIKERDGWVDLLHPRKKKYSTNLLSIALEYVYQGECAIYMPVFLAHEHNRSHKAQLVEFDMPKGLKRNFQTAYAVRAKHRPEDREFKRLCAIVRKMIHPAG